MSTLKVQVSIPRHDGVCCHHPFVLWCYLHTFLVGDGIFCEFAMWHRFFQFLWGENLSRGLISAHENETITRCDEEWARNNLLTVFRHDSWYNTCEPSITPIRHHSTSLWRIADKIPNRSSSFLMSTSSVSVKSWKRNAFGILPSSSTGSFHSKHVQWPRKITAQFFVQFLL